jgi:hypothetical protein
MLLDGYIVITIVVGVGGFSSVLAGMGIYVTLVRQHAMTVRDLKASHLSETVDLQRRLSVLENENIKIKTELMTLHRTIATMAERGAKAQQQQAQTVINTTGDANIGGDVVGNDKSHR